MDPSPSSSCSWMLAAAVALAFADASIVVLGLPAIYEDFDTTIVGVSWVITVYAVVVTLAGLGLVGARRHHTGAITAGGLALFTLASVGCGLAPSMGWLMSGALVGALFLGVLLVVEVWRFSPLAGAGVVSALPVGLFVVRPVRDVTGMRWRLVVGCATLAAGLVGLALLPEPTAGWAAGALALCGAGFGLVDPVLGDLALGGAGLPLRNAARDVTARHAGLVLGLLLIAPALSSDLQAGGERAVLAGADTMLEARLTVKDKIGVAQAVGRLVERTPRGQMPEVAVAFDDADVSGTDADVAADDLVHRIEAVLTRSFRRGFLIAAGLAVATLLPALFAAHRADRARAPGREATATAAAAGPQPQRVGAVALMAVIVAAVVFLGAALANGGRDAGEFTEADPCRASPDPYPGRGFDATLQRITLGGVNGAACALDVSRERLILSLADTPGIGLVPLDRDTLEDGLESGLIRAVDDAQDRGSLPGWVAGALRAVARNAPLSWVLNGLDLADLLPG